jgi:hypothetical protein
LVRKGFLPSAQGRQQKPNESRFAESSTLVQVPRSPEGRCHRLKAEQVHHAGEGPGQDPPLPLPHDRAARRPEPRRRARSPTGVKRGFGFQIGFSGNHCEGLTEMRTVQPTMKNVGSSRVFGAALVVGLVVGAGFVFLMSDAYGGLLIRTTTQYVTTTVVTTSLVGPVLSIVVRSYFCIGTSNTTADCYIAVYNSGQGIGALTGVGPSERFAGLRCDVTHPQSCAGTTIFYIPPHSEGDFTFDMVNVVGTGVAQYSGYFTQLNGSDVAFSLGTHTV